MTEQRCLITVDPAPRPQTRLIVFPHAGGSSTGYRRWASLLSSDIELGIVEYPGHGSRMGEELVPDHAVIVEEVATALAGGETPIALFGHSMGALIAFETARTLTSWGVPPIHVFISAAQTPLSLDTWVHRPWTDEELEEELIRFGGTPPEFLQDADMHSTFIEILRCDYRLLDQYVFDPDPLLDMGVTAFYGTEDSSVTYDDIRKWRALTGAGFDVHPLAGGHFYDPASLPELCARVEEVVAGLFVPADYSAYSACSTVRT